ncbi:uncharacterized protein LOC122510901 isoform X1 [Leptopilina heterotoma]|uniref:uncharacterized protein LOC122510901 isoform X1 n=1 Tax=Leptopilina heterotoma TaxID=63436 RepID=UPI001CA7C295|nr:uncharacterized protein LOC122510901 isoform X1 [Leptopilina heterotoma]
MAPYRLLFFSLSFIAVFLTSAQSTLSKRQDGTIEDSRKVPVNLTATRTSLIATDEGVKTKSTSLQRDSIQVSSNEDTSEEDLEENEASDNAEDTTTEEEDDEYEDELKAAAESHEAMSHDDTKKSNTSFYDSKSFDEKLITAKNFDSKEKSVEDGSDENETSNEADIDDDDIEKKKKDKEVEELLEKKRKRLPTVKKELRTQKEIQADNDTLEDEALTVNVLRMLAKLAENPERWERVHQLLMHLDDGREGSRRALLARKRNLLPTSYFDSISTTPKMDDPLRTFKKPKKKKKKKKPHHKATTQALPIMTSSVPTTESPWFTTSIPWRLVAENYNSPLWQEQIDDNPSSKLRYSKNRPRLPGHQLIDEKQRENLKTLNDQRQALMLKSAREYSQPRLLHFGKVNTHQVPPGHRDSSFDDETMRMRDYDPSEYIHFKHWKYPQYNNPLARDFSLDKFQNDLQNDFELNAGGFARNQEFRPSDREFAASKSWQNSPFGYRKPPKLDFRLVQMKNVPWYYKNPRDPKPWLRETLPWRKPLIQDYWSRMDDNDEDDMNSLEKSWHQRHHPQLWKVASDSWPEDKSLQVPPWSEKSTQNRPNQEQSFAWDRAKNRSEKMSPPKQNPNEKNIIPKITMKSWNSLTSDPATWPFKLPDAKPWPKDQNGKSYNPNADLVRKLGLDKQNKLLSEEFKNSPKDFKGLKYKERTSSELKSNDNNNKGKDSVWPVKLTGDDDWMSKVRSSENLSADDDARPSWTSNNAESGGKSWHGKSISPKAQSVRGWEVPVDQSTWRPYDLKSYEDSPSSPWSGRTNDRMWHSKAETGPWPQKIGEDWNEGYGKQAGTSNNWPSKWKQFAYHRVTAMPMTKAGSSMEGSAKPKNAFIAVSAVSSSKYNNNEWRKNDIEETPPISQNSFRSVDPDHPASQLRSSIESPIYAWKKDGSPSNKTRSVEILPSDPLEHQLEDLRLNSSSQDYSKSKTRENGSEFSTSLSVTPSNGSFVGNLTKEISKRHSNLKNKRLLELEK